MIRYFLSVAVAAFAAGPLLAQAKEPKKVERPTPTAANVAYGEHPRQKFDFWQAKSDKPTPLVLLIHGGGWVNGDKSTYGTGAIKPFLDAGISVASVNYRFIQHAMEEKVSPPVKAPLHDAARALQTAQEHAHFLRRLHVATRLGDVHALHPRGLRTGRVACIGQGATEQLPCRRIDRIEADRRAQFRRRGRCIPGSKQRIAEREAQQCTITRTTELGTQAFDVRAAVHATACASHG